MKSLNFLSILAVGFLSLTAIAQNNPQIRACHQTGGEFFVATSENDQIGFCKYDSAYIGTIDLLNYNDNIQGVQALQTYVDGIQSCDPYGQIQTLTIIQGTDLTVCRFADGSMIGLQTLTSGRHDDKNAKLNKALDLHF